MCVCIPASLIQHAKRMCCNTLSSVACLNLPYFFTLSHKRHDFRKRLLNIKCVFIFLTTLVWNIAHSKNNLPRYHHKCTQVSMSSTRYSHHILMKLEFSWHIFEKHLYTKFRENPSSLRQVVPCGRTDEQADKQTLTKLTVAFRNFANSPEKMQNSSFIYILQ
jgi:hypothetical protein